MNQAKRARKDTRDKLKARVLRLIGSREEMQSQEGQDMQNPKPEALNPKHETLNPKP